MGEKSRSNFACGGWCSEVKCRNRDKQCGSCLRKDKLDLPRGEIPCRFCTKKIPVGVPAWSSSKGWVCVECVTANLGKMGTSMLVLAH